MVDTGHYGNRYFGKWYTLEEAGEVEADMSENCRTGDGWQWVDRSGDTVIFSGSKRETKQNDKK